MDKETNIQELKEKVKEFCDKRDWEQYHNAKDLATGLILESAELLEHFLWKNPEEVKNTLNNTKKKEEIEDEVADIFYYLLRIAELNNIDLSEALERKLEKNDKKYPVDKVKGLNKKYNEY